MRNPGISQRELNYAVQTTIDRIVFLRICEDRAIEPYAQLMALLSGPDTYARLRVVYERADERYNSGLFHFHKERDRAGAPDTLTPKLQIDDKVLKAIIKRLYYPESPYEFSVLPAEILGQVYERFLGSVIRLTAGGQAKVEQKPEVRKAGGVYYTPSYIVDYIVKHTVGKLLEGKTPQEVAGVTESWRPSKTGRPLAVLDPACGSGSFLLGAYQYLLDWHLEYYSRDNAKWSTGKEPRIYQDHRGVWRLATSERKRILLANIYGVDIDAQAVEVTKLSLLLRVLEGENADTLQKQLTLLHERALPDLANNIKCGNSLIGPDFYQGKQLDAFDEEETYRINAFDWNAEFPQVMDKGFDARIDKGLQPLVHQSPEVWFVTFVTYCSRVSERMVEFGVTNSEGKGLQPLVFTADEQIAVAETLFDIARRHGFAFIALNVLPDHVHAVLPAPDEEVLAERVRILKVFSAQVVNQRRNAGKGAHVWAQKFNRSRVNGEDALNQICKYVYENHLKHQDRWGSKLLETWDKGLQPLVKRECKSPDAWDYGLQSDKGLQPLVPAQHTAADSPFASSGGFDAVIGNPPYVRQESLSAFKEFFEKRYQAYTSGADLYVCFIEKAIQLLQKSGRFAFIVSSSFLRTAFGEALRCVVKQRASVLRVVDFGGLPVFASAKDTYVCIPLITRAQQPERVEVARVTSLDPAELGTQLANVSYTIPETRLCREAWSLQSDAETATFEKIASRGRRLGEYIKGKMFRGILTGLNEAFVITEEVRSRIISESPTSARMIKSFYGGEDIRRYEIRARDIHIIAFPAGWTRQEMLRGGSSSSDASERRAWQWLCDNYSAIADHLKVYETPCRNRQDKGDFWWELRPCDYYSWMESPKVVFPDICKGPRFCIDVSGGYIGNTAYILGTDSLYLLGVLNSRLFWFAISNISIPFGVRAGQYRYRLIYQYMEKVPIRPIDLSDPKDRARHEKMVSLVQRMLDLHKRLQTARTEHERGVLERQIAATDEEIDHLVYELYDLTDEEIAIVKQGM